MNYKRIIFWAGFVIVLALIVWGLIVAMNKPQNNSVSQLGIPAPISSSDHIIGNPSAPITLVEYSDFQCPACEQRYYVVKKLLEDASSTVRLVYRNFPLPQHANAIIAAEAAEAASLQGRFADMYTQLFENATQWIDVSDPHQLFYEYASKIGLNINKFKADIDSAQVKSLVIAQRTEGENVGINETPTFFVNGKELPNAQTYDEFKSFVEDATSTSSN